VSEPADVNLSYTAGSKAPSETSGLPFVLADFDALLRINPDTVGWIAIPGTVISYPVVQTNDNAKYLDISFEGKYSKAGTPFADMDNEMHALDANTIIYGHNMGSGRTDMFGSLTEYKDNDYFSSHRYIQFNTVYEQHGWWRVFAVIEYDVRDDSFDPMQIRFADTVGFNKWIDKVKAVSLHDTDFEILLSDRILTLSTCDKSRYGREGRLLVMAVKLNEYQ